MADASPWRVFCALAAVGIVLQLVLLVGQREPRLVAGEIALGDTLPLMLVGFAACLAAVVHARGGWRDALALLLAVIAGFAAGAYATWAQMGGFPQGAGPGQSAWKSIALLALALPPALLWARRARADALLALVGAALALAGAVIASPRAVAFDNARALLGVAPFALGCLLVATALAREAWRPHAAPARPLPAWAFAGPFFLALAWALGGSFLLVVPLWIIAPVLLALPALLAWRRRPTAALAAIALLAAGALVPIATCSIPNISDVVPRPGEPRGTMERVSLWEVAGHGPYWVKADLMGGGLVACPPDSLLPAALWLAALAAVSWARWREPDALVRRLARAERA